MSKTKKKIIIVIDDIDRLNKNEIRQIFQLIKSIGDFKNTVYFLAFDRKVVVDALDYFQGAKGSDYLEKVIQVPFEVPAISFQKVQDLLLSQLDDIFAETPHCNWDDTYWWNVYHNYLKINFINIRDVNRFLNTFKFGYNLVYNEVNTIDFFAITTLQIFLPDLYYEIRDNKELFSGVMEIILSNKSEEKERLKEEYEAIFKKINIPNKNEFLKFMQLLFPKIESSYGNTIWTSDWLDTWRKERKICSPEVFDIFFSLSIPKEEISKSEIEKILKLATDPKIFSQSTQKLIEKGRIIKFLDLLGDFISEEIPISDIENILSVFMDIGDHFPESNSGLTYIGTSMRFTNLISQLCYRFNTQDERYNLLKLSMEHATQSLYTVVHEVSLIDQQHGNIGDKKNHCRMRN